MPSSNKPLLDKQTVLVTGVSSGIGSGITKELLNEGHRVFGSVRSSKDADRMQSLFGKNFTPLIFDITSEEQVAHAKQQLTEALGGQSLDAIVNNAGIAEMGPLIHVPIEILENHLNVLVSSQLRVIQAFYELLMPADGSTGTIFNISSVSGVNPNPLFGCYAAGKHALEGLSKTLRNELREFNVKVVVVAPGNIKTDIWKKQTDQLALKYKNTIYYEKLVGYLAGLRQGNINNAMTVEEFSGSFYKVFNCANPADRYTIVKSRKWRYPISLLTKVKTRVLVG